MTASHAVSTTDPRTGIFTVDGSTTTDRWRALEHWATNMAAMQRDVLRPTSGIRAFAAVAFTPSDPRWALQGYTATRLRVLLDEGSWRSLDHHALLQVAALVGIPSDVLRRGVERESRTVTAWLLEEWHCLGDVTHRWRLDGNLVRAVLSDAYGPLDTLQALHTLTPLLQAAGVEPIRVIHAVHRHRIEFGQVTRTPAERKGLRPGLVLTNSETADAALTLAPAVVGSKFTSRLYHASALEVRHTLHSSERFTDRAPTAVPQVLHVATDAVMHWGAVRLQPVPPERESAVGRALETALGRPLTESVLNTWRLTSAADRTWLSLYKAVTTAIRTLNDPFAQLETERLLSVCLYADDGTVATAAGTRPAAPERGRDRARRSATALAMDVGSPPSPARVAS